MVVWSGRGYLSIIVLLVTFALFASILPKGYSDYAFIISLFFSGIFCWFMGRKWNSVAQTMIDKDSGEEVILKPNHSLFWIKMQYWGPFFAVLGLIILVQQFI